MATPIVIRRQDKPGSNPVVNIKIGSSYATEYPSAWFNAHPNEKPDVHIMKCDG